MRTCAVALPVLAAHVRDRKRQVDNALLQLAGARRRDVRLEGRADRRKHRAMEPGRRPAAFGEAGLEMLRAYRVVVVVPDLVLARPRHLDGRADLARQHRRLGDEVRL
jgi:hypothetical protein